MSDRVSRRERRKRRWFEDGMRALERITGEPAPGYVCPICRRWFTELDEVTFEHAPPKSVGGRGVALTCRECNSGAGHGIDAELRKVQDLRDWQRGRLGKPLRARFTFDGVPLNVDVDRSPEMVTVFGLPEHNDPANTAAWNDTFGRASDTGEPIQFAFPGFVERHARIALLRAAYVLAFAVLGYRYALRPTLEVVREQILNPEEVLIERFSLHRAEARHGRSVVWVEQPASVESFVVEFDDHLVFLPGAKADGRIYERLMTRKRWPPGRDFYGRMVIPKVFDWPTRPMHLMDVDDLNPAE